MFVKRNWLLRYLIFIVGGLIIRCVAAATAAAATAAATATSVGIIIVFHMRWARRCWL